MLEAIGEDPEGAAPLAYAEWLRRAAAQDDDSDPDHARAELIRLQVQLARGTDPGGRALGPGQAASMRRRADELHSLHGREWDGPLYELGALEVDYGAGVPRHVTMFADDFLARGDRLFEAAPTVTSLRLMGTPGPAHAAALAASPRSARLTRLRFETGLLGEEGARALAGSRHLRNLTELSIDQNGIGAEGAGAIADSPHFSAVTHLDLAGNSIGAEGARAIADSPFLTSLTRLVLNDCQVGDKGAGAIAASPRSARLARLDLRMNDITDDGARALAGSRHLSNLTELDLGLNGLSEDGGEAVRDSEHLRHLTRLNLLGNDIGRRAREEIDRAIRGRSPGGRSPG